MCIGVLLNGIFPVTVIKIQKKRYFHDFKKNRAAQFSQL